MKGKQMAWAVVSSALVVVLGSYVWRMSASSGTEPAASPSRGVARAEEPGRPASASLAKDESPARPAPRGGDAAGAVIGETTEETSEPRTEEEKREAEEEKLVNAFDDPTDKWMEPASKGVTMTDVDAFAKAFRRIPKARRDECVHRALNLIPNENVMLLAGILMDKSMDKEIVETVYNDILNRDEDVKKPILQQIFKDKSHPCWADTAWILDVTGELPKAK